MKIGRKIYFDVQTGNVLVNTGERQGSVRPTTVAQDITVYKVLSERNRDTFDVIDLAFGQYARDFAECNDYRVNPETKTLEFSYPDPNETKPSEPVYQAPLSEKVAQLEQENTLLKAQNNVLVERTDFHEEVLSEIILTITS